MMNSILVIELKNIFVQNQPISYEVGFIDPDTKFLTNITSSPSLTLSIEEGDATINQTNNTILSLATGNVIIRVNYLTYESIVSLWVVSGLILPKQVDMSGILYGNLPPNCYTSSNVSTVYSKISASAKVLADIYFNNDNISFQYLLDNLYPPFATSFSWEQELNNNYPWEGSYDYSLVIQTVRNLFLTTDCPYDSALNISQYIYARFGRSVYVYIKEYNTIFTEQWELGVSQLGISTILGLDLTNPKTAIVYIQDDSSFYTTSILTELIVFCQKIFPADVTLSIEVIPDFSILGLVVYLQDVYQTDPRLLTQFAILYEPTAVYNAYALISPYNPIFISSLDISPSTNTSAPLGPEVSMTATLAYNAMGTFYYVVVTDTCVFTSSNTNVYTIDNNNAVPGASLGNSEITATYLNPLGAQFNVNTTVNYYVNSGLWVLGDSMLGDTTTL